MRPSSILIFCLAALFAGEAVVAIAHRAERHVRCAEHGELIHAGAADSSTAIDLDRESPAGDVERAPPTGEPEHEHCFILGMSRERLAPSACVHSSPAAAPVAVAPAPNPSAPPIGRSVYRFAPKNSPPA
jgi:hypothetical protein